MSPQRPRRSMSAAPALCSTSAGGTARPVSAGTDPSYCRPPSRQTDGNRNSPTAAARTSSVGLFNLGRPSVKDATSGSLRRLTTFATLSISMASRTHRRLRVIARLAVTADRARWCRCWLVAGVVTTNLPPGPGAVRDRVIFQQPHRFPEAPRGSPGSVPTALSRSRRPTDLPAASAAISSPMVAANTRPALPRGAPRISWPARCGSCLAPLRTAASLPRCAKRSRLPPQRVVRLRFWPTPNHLP